LESLAGERGQNEGRLMNLLAVVLAQLLLLLGWPAAKWLLEVTVGILAADHEANLTGWVCGDRRVAVLNVGEDLLARLLEIDNERHMQPLILGYAHKQVSGIPIYTKQDTRVFRI
jgi:hypothetical protein